MLTLLWLAGAFVALGFGSAGLLGLLIWREHRDPMFLHVAVIAFVVMIAFIIPLTRI